MKDTDLIYYEMFRQVSATMHKNESIWGTNTIIVGCVVQLDGSIIDIKEADLKLGNSTKILTIGKTSLHKSITTQAFLIKDNMRLYYRINKNIAEMQLLTYPITKFNRMSDSEFYLEVTRISEESVVMADQLLPFGITITMINKLKDDLLTLYKITPQRELLTVTNANLIKFIPAKIKECRLMLRHTMDTLVANYKAAYPKFIIAYDFSRERHLRPGAHKHYTITINGKLTQVNTTNALANVTIIAGKQQKTTTTDINGNYTIKIYIKDADNITFTYPGFESQTIAITLIEPEKHKKAEATINVEMVKKKEI